MNLKSGIIDRFETQIRVIPSFQKLHDDDHNFLLSQQYSIELTNIIKVLLSSPFHAHVTDVLNASTVKRSFPGVGRLNVNINMLKTAMQKPERGFWSNGIRLWDLPDEFLHSFSQGLSIFMFILRFHWETLEFRHDKRVVEGGEFQHSLYF